MVSQNYFHESYHFSINATATASLNFTGMLYPLPSYCLRLRRIDAMPLGTGAWVFGGRRSTSGGYSVQIDNQPVQTFGASPNGVTEYQVLLGGVNGLPFGDHRIVVTNLPTDQDRPVLDIDAFLVETAAGSKSGSGDKFSGPTVVDNAAQHAGITFSADGWATKRREATRGAQRNGTVHESNVNGASVEFSFEGQGVGVIGAVGPSNGNFKVELDDKDMGEMSTKASISHPSTPIVSSLMKIQPGRWVLTNNLRSGL